MTTKTSILCPFCGRYSYTEKFMAKMGAAIKFVFKLNHFQGRGRTSHQFTNLTPAMLEDLKGVFRQRARMILAACGGIPELRTPFTLGVVKAPAFTLMEAKPQMEFEMEEVIWQSV